MNPRLSWLIAAAVALLLTGWTFGDALGQLGSAFLGFEYVDGYGTQWFYWFVERSVRSGEPLGHTDLFFHPWGKEIFAHTGTNVLDAYLALPFRMLLGPVAGYNVFVLLALLANGVAFAFLAGQLTRDRLAIGLGAVLFAFTPYILFETSAGRPTQALMVFPVLTVLFMWRSGVRRGLLAPTVAGIALGVSGYQYWYYAFFFGVGCLLHGLWRTARPPEEAGSRWRVLGRHALIAAVALAVTLPFAHSLLTGGASGEDTLPGMLDMERWSMRSNPPLTVEGSKVGLFMWQPALRQTGAFVQDLDGTERFLFRGTWMLWLMWLSVALWLWHPGRLDRGPVAAMMAGGLLLAIGPLLLLGGLALPNPPYILLTKALPFMQRLWWPARAFSLLSVLVGLTVVVNLAHLRRLGPWPQVAIGAALALIWAVELSGLGYLPMATWSATAPAGYRCLEHGPDGALMELPYAWTQGHLYYQTLHGRPIMGGMLEDNPEFTPDEVFALHDDNTFVSSLLYAAHGKSSAPVWTEGDMAAVEELGYRYVVLQKDAFHIAQTDPGLLDNVRRLQQRRITRTLQIVAGAPVYDDRRMSIFSPWGAPSPCEGVEIEPDRAAVGRADTPSEELFTRNFEDQVLTRLITPNPADTVLFVPDDEEADDDSADDDSAGGADPLLDEAGP